MPTAPAVLDIPIARGSSGAYSAVTLAFEAGEAAPFDLTGCTVTLVSTRAKLSKSTADGSLVMADPTTGTVSWVPTQAETLAIPAGRLALYSASIALPDGSQGPYLSGFLIGYDGEPPQDARLCPSYIQDESGAWAARIAPDEGGPVVIRVITPGPQGAAGSPGAAASTAFYAIAGVASFTARHGLAYVPRVTLLDSGGAEVDTDTTHSPGQTVLSFASPFTGTLWLS